MQHVKLWKIHLLVCCFIVGVVVAACTQTSAVLLPPSLPAQITTATPVGEAPASETVQPANITEESPLPLPNSAPNVAAYQVLTRPNDVSFQFPGDWQLDDLGWGPRGDGNKTLLEKHYFLRPSGRDIFENGISVLMTQDTILASQEPILFYRAGDVIDPDAFFGPILVVWDKDVVINGNEWHLYIQGQVYDIRHDGLEYLREKGAITAGSIVALHYVEEREFYIRFSQELNREMLIALDAQGGDVVLSDYLQTFNEILASVTISP